MEKSMIGTSLCAQIGILCHNIEQTAAAWSTFLGQDYTISGTPPQEIAKTNYRGEPTPAGCKQAFFKVGEHLDIELIEPDAAPSTWRHDLDEKGEGIHHIAFWVKDTDGQLKKLEGLGMNLIQRGQWPGGQYAYLDAMATLKVTLELLEHTNE